VGDVVSLVLAVDPGEARLGVAVSDPTGTVARPLTTLTHTSRDRDAAAIADLARNHEATLIVVGLPLDSEGQIGPRARRSLRLAEALRGAGPIPVKTWDESGSTVAAARERRSDRSLDARAAAVILQDFLDAQTNA
jgi:putative holliday junction resolvase